MQSQTHKVYAIPANRHLTLGQLRGRVQDTVKLHSVWGGEESLDMVRTHMQNVHDCRIATIIYAYCLARINQYANVQR
jgi:hypothetical protein